MHIAQASLGERGAVNRLKLGQVLPALRLPLALRRFGHGGTIPPGVDQRAAQFMQRTRHQAAPVEIHDRRQPREKRRATPNRFTLQHVHPMPQTSHRIGNGLARFTTGKHHRRERRLRREQAAAAPCHFGRERLAQPASGLLGRQKQERGA